MTLPSSYDDLHVPLLPVTEWEIHPKDNAKTICRKIDLLFDIITSGYPNNTRLLLLDMYFNNRNVHPMDGYLEQGTQANWTVCMHDLFVGYHMTIDRRLMQCPILQRLNKIHEIAGHIGQANQRIRAVGFDQFEEEMHSNKFHIFTEQSIALVEKMLIDALPEKVIKADIKNIQDPRMRSEMLKDFKIRRALDYDRYSRLAHRKKSCPASAMMTEKDYQQLHDRPDVSAFDERMRQKMDQLHVRSSTSALSG